MNYTEKELLSLYTLLKKRTMVPLSNPVKAYINKNKVYYEWPKVELIKDCFMYSHCAVYFVTELA